MLKWQLVQKIRAQKVKNLDFTEIDLSDADLRDANLSSANLSGANLSSANLRDANVENARFGYNLGISESLKHDLIVRGAIFEDSLGDRSGMPVFILLYNAGTDNEGIHTIDYDNDTKILMFESAVGANYFASLLEAYNFPKPTIESIEDTLVEEFCSSKGYSFEFIASDQIAIPPKNHADVEERFQKTTVFELDSEHKKYYLKTIRDTYFILKKNIADLKQELARTGFSVSINRQIEYYTEEVNKIEIEIKEWSQ